MDLSVSMCVCAQHVHTCAQVQVCISCSVGGIEEVGIDNMKARKSISKTMRQGHIMTFVGLCGMDSSSTKKKRLKFKFAITSI